MRWFALVAIYHHGEGNGCMRTQPYNLLLVKDLAPRAGDCRMRICTLSLIYETRISLFLKLQRVASDLINFPIP